MMVQFKIEPFRHPLKLDPDYPGKQGLVLILLMGILAKMDKIIYYIILQRKLGNCWRMLFMRLIMITLVD